MNREDIIRMARGADEGFETDTFHEESLVGMDAIERFARLVAAAEREACAAWVRTNYMDHSVDSLCESLRARSNP